jgi:hypothetical protein
MRHRLHRIPAVAASALLLLVAMLSFAQPANASLDNTHPIQTGCSSTARTIDTEYLNGPNVTLQLRYSTSCRTVWARVTIHSDNGNRCAPGNIFCATATITRNHDQVSLSCETPAGYHTSCYTNQLSDAGVTSHAFGCYDTGRLRCARTIDY